MSDHLKGLLIVSAGVFALSFDALLVRLSQAGTADIVFWRGIFMFIALSSLILISYARSGTFKIRPIGGFLATGVVAGVGLLLFPLSLSYTSTANTVVILTSAPFFAAILSRLILKERIPRHTICAIAVVFSGILFIFAGSLTGSGLTGDLFAVLAAINLGLSMTIMRLFPGLSRLAIICAGGLVAAIISFPFSHPASLEPISYGVLAVSGLVQMPTAMVLIAVGTRFLPAAEVGLLIVIEAILAPIWVWVVLREEFTANTLYGGVVILVTIAIHSWISLKENRVTNSG